MAKSAVSTPSNHTFLSLKEQNTEAPTESLSNVTNNLWRQGISVSHWDFISSKKLCYRPIWLPPHQFRPTSHWLTNVDRVIEVQSSIPEPTRMDEHQTKAPPKLVTPENLSAGEFRTHPSTKRFRKIVSGRAVRQRPLCPASMYMESAAMAVQLLHRDLNASSLYFEDMLFQAALGVDSDREITMTLEKTDDSCSWILLSRAHPKLTQGQESRLMLRVKLN